jgi:hypothetical protein
MLEWEWAGCEAGIATDCVIAVRNTSACAGVIGAEDAVKPPCTGPCPPANAFRLAQAG